MDPFDYVDLMFDSQGDIKTFADTANDEELVNYIADLTATSLSVNKADFINGMNDANLDWSTRVAWKYGCSLGANATPTTYMNRVFFGDDSISRYTLEDWKNVIDPMLDNRSQGSRTFFAQNIKYMLLFALVL